MKNTLIAAGILYAAYKFAPNPAIKAMALGVAGTVVAGYVPYLNGKDISGKALA